MVALQTEIAPKEKERTNFRPKETNFRPKEENSMFIGEGVTVKGEISAPEIIIVDGLVEGVVNSRTLVVGPSGAVKGTVTVTNAEIYGVVSEKLEVKQLLVVHSSGRIDGNAIYGELELAKGAVIIGAFSSSDLRSEKKVREPQSKVGTLRGTSNKYTPDPTDATERQQMPLAEVGPMS